MFEYHKTCDIKLWQLCISIRELICQSCDIYFIKSIFLCFWGTRDKTLLVGKLRRKHTQASGLRCRRCAIFMEIEIHRVAKIPGGWWRAGKTSEFMPPSPFFSSLPPSLPLTPAVDQCVDGFHFRGVKVLHHRKLKSRRENRIANRNSIWLNHYFPLINIHEKNLDDSVTCIRICE